MVLPGSSSCASEHDLPGRSVLSASSSQAASEKPGHQPHCHPGFSLAFACIQADVSHQLTQRSERFMNSLHS